MCVVVLGVCVGGVMMCLPSPLFQCDTFKPKDSRHTERRGFPDNMKMQATKERKKESVCVCVCQDQHIDRQ